jgi:hypothetical protein
MSPNTSASATPRTTDWQWWMAASSVTGIVVGWPRAKMPSVSPTSTSGTPAWSSACAVG